MTTRNYLGELFETHHFQALAVAMHVMRNRADAEDAVQDAFVRALETKSPWSQQTAKSSLFTWFHRVVFNSSLMRLRVIRGSTKKVRDTREFVPLSEELVDYSPSPYHAAIATQQGEMISREVSAMTEKTQTVLFEYHIEGRSIKEISTRTGLSQIAVKARLAHARCRLRKRLEELGIR